MKKIVFILILIVCISSAYSQFDAQYSQYMLNQTAFNPAAVGESGMIDVIGRHRIQWVGMPNGGRTTNFSINSPLKIQKTNHGLGVSFYNEKVGLFINQGLHLQYAFKQKIGKGVLSIGPEIGYISLGFNGDSVKTHPITYGKYHDLTSDGDIPQGAVSGMSFDLGIGAWYSTPKSYIGVSYKHLNQPEVNWGETTGFKQNGLLFFTGGTSTSIADTKIVIKPSTLFKTDFTTWIFDLTGKMEYDDKYWGGLSYRFQDAVVLFGGINIAGGLSIGYSYDLPTTQIINGSTGSHEIVLAYSFAYVFGKKSTKYKSIRFL